MRRTITRCLHGSAVLHTATAPLFHITAAPHQASAAATQAQTRWYSTTEASASSPPIEASAVTKKKKKKRGVSLKRPTPPKHGEPAHPEAPSHTAADGQHRAVERGEGPLQQGVVSPPPRGAAAAGNPFGEYLEDSLESQAAREAEAEEFAKMKRKAERLELQRAREALIAEKAAAAPPAADRSPSPSGMPEVEEASSATPDTAAGNPPKEMTTAEARAKVRAEFLEEAESRGAGQAVRMMQKVRSVKRRPKKKKGSAPTATPTEEAPAEPQQPEEVRDVGETPDASPLPGGGGETSPRRRRGGRKGGGSARVGMTTEVPQLMASARALERATQKGHAAPRTAVVGVEEQGEGSAVAEPQPPATGASYKAGFPWEGGEEGEGAPAPAGGDVEEVVQRRSPSKSYDDAMRNTLELLEEGADAEIRKRGKAPPARPAGRPAEVEAEEMEGGSVGDGESISRFLPGNAPHGPGESDRFAKGFSDGTCLFLSGDKGQPVFIKGPEFSPKEFKPFSSWDEVYDCIPPSRGGRDVLPGLIRFVEMNGFTGLTAVQKYAFPLVFSGQNIIAQAPTGTGKTLAYAIPAVAHAVVAAGDVNKTVSGEMKGSRPSVLILTPHRAIARQIFDEVNRMLGGSRVGIYDEEVPTASALKVKLICEGAARCDDWHGMLALSKSGADIVIGTLSKFAKYTEIAWGERMFLSHVSHLIVDEADSEGVLTKHLRKITTTINADKELFDRKAEQAKEVVRIAPSVQVSLWGATQQGSYREAQMDFRVIDIFKLLDRSPTRPQHVDLRKKMSDDELITLLKVGNTPLNPDIRHRLYACSYDEKFSWIVGLFKEGELSATTDKVIVFCKGTTEAVELHEHLRSVVSDMDVVKTVTGDMSPDAALLVFKEFASGEGNVLITTDMATRGYDVPSCTHVVLLGLPHKTQDWIHAVGRCARAGRPGTAYTVFTHLDVAKIPAVIGYLRETHPYNPIFTRRSTKSIRSKMQDRFSSVEAKVDADEEEEGTGVAEKKIHISESLFSLAERMDVTLKLMGIKEKEVERYMDGMTSLVSDTFVDSYDPDVSFTMAPEISHSIVRRRVRFRKMAKKRQLEGAFRQEAQLMLREAGSANNSRQKHTLMKNDVMVEAAVRRDQSQKEQSVVLEKKAKDWNRMRRDAQIAAWRKRTGITDESQQPDLHKSGPARSHMPSGTVINEPAFKVKYESRYLTEGFVTSRHVSSEQNV